MHLLKRSIIVAVVSLAAACAGTPGPHGASPRSNPDVITEAELEPHAADPVRQVIERLRPRFLRSRGTTSLINPGADQLVVYLGGARMGSIEYLNQITASEIREVRYLSATDATQRFGTGHSAGAIVLLPR